MTQKPKITPGASPLRFAGFSLIVIFGCTASGSEPDAHSGIGGAGGSTGPSMAGGSPGSFAGRPGVAGSSQPAAGRGGGTAGSTPKAGGATGLGGSASTPSGGSGTSAGATGATGAAGSGVDPAGCGAAKGDLAAPLLYNGGLAPCSNALTPPRTGYWFAYNDATAIQTPAPTALPFSGEAGGKGGATDCAMHTSGTGFSKWGAGIGFDIHSANSVTCPFDASVFSGIRFYAKGTTTGTHGALYAPAPNTIRVKVKMSSRLSAGLGGDDFGGWCSLTPDWSLCDIPFATLAQEGYGPLGVFSKAELTQIQFQAAKEGTALLPPSVGMDFWVDDVTFY